MHQLDQPLRLAGTGVGVGNFCPQRPGQKLAFAPSASAAALWGGRSSELMAQLEGGRALCGEK